MAIIIAVASFIALLLFSPMIGVLVGAFSGFIVGWLAPVWVPSGLALVGIKVSPEQLVYLGAALGFIGGFFRASQTNNNN